MSDLSEVEQALVDAAIGPAETVNLAGEKIKMHPLKDLLAVKQDLERKASASSSRLPIKFFKIRPPGAV